MTILGATWHTARKQHGCDVCGGIIGVGDRYHRQRSIYDGEPQTFKAHGLCDVAYWRAHRDLDLYDDESPDWTEDIKPLIAAMLTLVGPTAS